MSARPWEMQRRILNKAFISPPNRHGNGAPSGVPSWPAIFIRVHWGFMVAFLSSYSPLHRFGVMFLGQSRRQHACSENTADRRPRQAGVKELLLGLEG